MQDLRNTDQEKPSFGANYNVSVGTMQSVTNDVYKSQLKNVYQRLSGAQIFNRDGVQLLERVKDLPEMVIYCDPPYYTSDNSGYSNQEYDIDRFTDALLAQKDKVAISGYDDEWSHLEWRYVENVRVIRKQGYKEINDGAKYRTERLWMNYETQRRLL